MSIESDPMPDLPEHHLALLINSVVDYAIYMLDPSGKIISWNEGARRLKGYSSREIIGQDYSLFFTDEDREAGLPQRALVKAADEGRSESEGWRVRKDGTRFWANAVLDAVRDQDGELIGFAKITRDITERHAAEQALYESEQRFRMLIQSVRDYAIYMLDTEGRVSNWNAGAEAIKGYAADEVVGSHFSRFYTEEDRASGKPAHALETALREGKYEAEAWRIRKDGSRFFAHVALDPIFDDQGNHVGFAKITRDITERRNAQIELEETRLRLFQAQKLQALGELTGGIAHDFNNLMTIIRGSAELLANNDLPEEKRARYMSAIIDTADRASTLTSHLLAFGRRQALKPEVIDLNRRLDAFVEVLQRTLGTGIEVELSLGHGLALVEVDGAQLETALLNAAFNARDAMPGGGKLTVSADNLDDDQGQWVCVAISDTGLGMPEEVLSRAFEPFFTTKPVGKGTGLGLSQIHGFAAQSGGRAEIISQPDEGTTIRLILPRSRAAAADSDTPQTTFPEPAGETILLVEDNEQVREFAHTLLTDLGYRVVDAASADEAEASLKAKLPDLLFSDIVMHGRSGIALAKGVRDMAPDLPILLATGYSQEALGNGAMEFDVLSKPYSANNLAFAIAKALGTRARAAEQSMA